MKLLATGMLFAGLVASSVYAQTPLRVLRYTPSDSGTPGSLITVTFSRPVAGMLGQSIDARTVMSIRPAVEGLFEWRDPVTLQFVPAEPFTPGARFTVSVDTAAIATAGTRSGARFQFDVRIPGPTPRAQLVEGQMGNPVGPRPLFEVLYSAPVDLDSLKSASRVVFSDSCGGTRQLRAIRQRPLLPNETDRFAMQIGYARPDSMTTKFLRVVELEPVDSLPPGCVGQWVVVPFDAARPNDTWRYRINTHPLFKVQRVSPVRDCPFRQDIPCVVESIAVAFTAPPRKIDIARHLRTIPAFSHDTVSLLNDRLMVNFSGRTEPRRQYQVVIDSTFRDIYGRRLQGPNTFTVTAPDRKPGIKQQSGLVTLAHSARQPASVTVRAMNVDTMIMHVIPIPDSLIPALLSTDNERRYYFVPRISPALRDTFHIPVPVKGQFNLESNFEVAIPDSIIKLGKLLGIRFAIGARSIAPDSLEFYARNPKRLADERTQAAREDKMMMQYQRPDFGMIVQVNSWQAHTKVAGDHGAVFVTGRDGTPVPGATVSLYAGRDGLRAQGLSSATGLATLVPVAGAVHTEANLERDADPALTALRYVTVTRGAERLIVPAEAPIATPMTAQLDAQSLGVRLGRPIQVRGAVLPDRDLYRPGETMFIKVFTRSGVAGNATAAIGDSIRVALVNGNLYWNGWRFAIGPWATADTVWKWNAVLSQYGTALDSLVIPTAVRPGNHVLLAELLKDGQWQSIAQANVRIEEFRAPEFLVTMRGDTSLKFLGDTIVANVSAKYLYGAAMAGARVQWSAVAGPGYGIGRAIPGAVGYAIGSESWWDDRSGPQFLQFSREDSLNRDGQLEIRIPTKPGTLTRNSPLVISAAVSDMNNQTVTARTSANLQASSIFIGAKDRNTNWYWKSGAAQTLDIIALRANGERVAGASLSVTIVRRRYTTDTAAATVGQRRWVADTVKQTTLMSARLPVPFMFTPTSDGAYDIRFETIDEKGRPALTNLGRWVYAEPRIANDWKNTLALAVTTQRATGVRYSLRETARVMFESPFPSADAWITIEREGVLEQRRMIVNRGVTTVPVPVKAEFAPNIWVGVSLFNRSATPPRGADSVAQLMRAGYVEIRVDSTAHLLKVAIEPRAAVVAPGDSVEVLVKVTDASTVRPATRSRSEVSLWAVDEGVLSMTAFKTPDLLGAIDAQLGVSQKLRTSLVTLPWVSPTGSVRPGVNVRSTRDGLVLAARMGFSVAEFNTGMQVQMQASEFDPRSIFRFTAFYVGAVLTDSNGIARIRAKLPDNITTFRLMASAIGLGHRYGSGEATLLATRRVVLRPALPRFVRGGDSLQAATLLNLRGGSESSLRVTAQFGGANLLDDSTRVVTVSPDKGAVTGFRIVIPETSVTDATRVRFTAVNTASGDRDAFEVRLPIRPTGTPRSHTVVGMVRDTATVTLNLPADIDPARSTVSFGLGTSPMVAMRSHYDRLRAYEYYTTDLVIASARALLKMSKAERILGASSVLQDTVRNRADLQNAVNTLVQLQRADGSFPYWPNSWISIGPWLTADAGQFLLEAEREGLVVPTSTLTRIRESFSRGLRENNWRPDTVSGSPLDRRHQLHYFLGVRVVIAQFLRAAGSPEVATEDSLIKRAQLMAWEDRVGLIDLMSQRPELNGRTRSMLEQLWTGVRVAGRRVDFSDSLNGSAPFPSHVRPASRLLLTALKVIPEHPLIGALSETIVQQGAAERGWSWNAHDHAAAVEALAELVQKQRGVPGGQLVARTESGRVVLRQATATSGTAELGGEFWRQSLNGLTTSTADGATRLSLKVRAESPDNNAIRDTPFYFSMTVQETPRTRPVTPDIGGMVVERWYERLSDGTPIVEASEGELVRVRLRVTAPADRQFVALEDLLPAGLEAVDLSMRTSGELGPFTQASNAVAQARQRDAMSTGSIWQNALYGGWGNGAWDGGWWSPWEHKELRDDRVYYFTRQLWAGTYNTSYLARATTVGKFVRPPAHAEEMYNAAVQGRSDGGVFTVKPRQ